ncbi:hypothetical protein M3Y98_00026400 [Aphelenchoides besseyi]|nr:hypothetical protein M3Y98_00026400 [Aphelenchoides besseyi]KAI6199306.1 hypothetical protein M3Y96_00612900 [Aphelenchoides besseyi]
MLRLTSAVFSLLLVLGHSAPTQDDVQKLVAYVSTGNGAVNSQLDDAKKVIDVPTSDQFINIVFGATNPATIKTHFVLESDLSSGFDTTYVFGKSCANTACRTPAPASLYQEGGTNLGAWNAGSVKGNLFKDQITLGTAKMDATFGSINDKTSISNTFDGEFSLGIGNQFAGFQNLRNLGPEKYLTIYRDDSAGNVLIGRNGHDKCNAAKFYGIVDGHWRIGNSKVEVDGKSVDSKVQFNIHDNTIGIPTEQYNLLVKDAQIDPNTKLVGDANKLKKITFTLGSDTYVLNPADFTEKTSDNKFIVKVHATVESDAAGVVLGVPFLKQNCYVLDGKSDDQTKWQIGVGKHVGKNSAAMMGASVVLITALAQLLRF